MLKEVLVRLSVILLVCGLSMTAHAMADQKTHVNVPAGDLTAGLELLAKQSGAEFVYSADQLKGLRTHGVAGELSAKDAVTKLLDGTKLQVRMDATGAMLIAPPTASATAQASAAPGDNTTQEGKSKSSGNFLLAQSIPGQGSGDVSVGPEDHQSSERKPKEPLEQVVVTGSRIPTVEGRQALPLMSYSKEDIEQSGQTTITDFLNTLPDVSISNVESGLSDLTVGKTTVQLHGLPVGTTLVLLNGYRLETSSEGYFDLGNIPASAVERIEILPVGASAIYGADALGGAVNIILRKDLNGFEVNGNLGHAANENDGGGNLSWGKNWGQGSVSLIGTFQDRGKLLGSDRTLTSTTQFPANAPTFIYLTDACAPGNVYSLTGANLPGLSSSQAGIPAGISGTPTLAQFVATAGKLNRCSTDYTEDLIPFARREGALLSAHNEFSEAIDLFTEVILTHEELEAPQLFGINASHATLSATNPYNPFGETVGVSFADPSSLVGYSESATMFQPRVGVRGSLYSDWHYEATAYLSRDRFQADVPNGNGGAIQAALSSSDPATALNPFTTGTPGPTQLLSSLIAPGVHEGFDSRLVDAQVVLRGPLFQLPAGPLETVLGSEYGHETQETQVLDNGVPLGSLLNLHRTTYAAFMEGRVPLLADTSALSRLSDRLTLTVAGRYDHSDDFGGKATWQSGLLWRPTEAISVNASYGVSYKAPTLSELGGGVAYTTNAYTVSDPLRGGQTVNPLVENGSNANLKPETGNSRTVGLLYAPQTQHGLRASLTYFDIKISDYIGQPSVPTIVNNQSFYPGLIVRAPPTAEDLQLGYPGIITQINQIYVNFGDLDVAGLDADLRYGIGTALGEITPSLAIANIDKWQSALIPGAAPVSGVSQAIGYTGIGWAPRWKGVAAMAWKSGSLSANLAGRYTGRYRDYQDFAPNSNELGNFWLFDLNIRYDLGKTLISGNSPLESAYVALGAVNLFDRAPRFSYDFVPYDPTQYDIRGRFVYTQFGIRW
jgi:iron complex outermembrane receptor protein